MSRPRWLEPRLALFVAIVVAAALYASRNFVLRSGVTDFVPASEEAELESIARELVGSDLTRSIFLTVSAPRVEGEDTDAVEHALAAVSAQMATRIEAEPTVAGVERGADASLEEAFYRTYFAHRFAFGPRSIDEARELVSEEGIGTALALLEADLTGSMAVLARRIAPEDPLRFFRRLLDRSRERGAHARVVEGQLVLVAPDAEHAVLIVRTEGNTFDADRIEPLLVAIDRSFEEARASLPEELRGSLVLEQASVHRFAVRTERALRRDSEWISGISSLAIAVLFLALFRRLEILLLGALPLLFGTVIAIAVTLLVFGSVHAITLAFGSSMLGVGIDFVSHIVNHHVLTASRIEGGRDPEDTARELAPGLWLGALTSVAGLAALGISSFPGMRELAVFSSSGVFGALLAARFVVPPFLARKPEPTRLHLAVTELVRRWVGARGERLVRASAVLAALLVVATLVGLPRVDFVDDLRAMNEVDPALVAEDQRVRARLSEGDGGRFVLSIGADDGEALAISDRVEDVLVTAESEGLLEAHRSVHGLLRSAATQRAITEVVTGPEVAPRVRTILERDGFVPELFAPFFDALRAPPEPLAPEELLASPLARLVRAHRIELGEDGRDRRVAYAAFVRGVRDPAALASRLRAVSGHFFDQGEYLRSAYRLFRQRAASLVSFGLVMVFLSCLLRYRSLRLAFASIAPAVLASLASVALVALSGQPVNLLHLVACLLVLSMGEDYAVFLLETRDEHDGAAITLVGLLVACATTVLSFGLLAFSSHPALAALGQTSALGVLFSFLLAPLSLAIAGRRGS